MYCFYDGLKTGRVAGDEGRLTAFPRHSSPVSFSFIQKRFVDFNKFAIHAAN